MDEFYDAMQWLECSFCYAQVVMEFHNYSSFDDIVQVSTVTYSCAEKFFKFCSCVNYDLLVQWN